MTLTPFSLLIAVYHKENPDHFRLALESIWHHQIRKPSEIVLIEDGPLTPELDQVIERFEAEAPVKRIRFPKNRGLGIVLAEGVHLCQNEWIARMDSDDISLPERFEKQLSYLATHPEVDIVGATIAEFNEDPGQPVAYRHLPERQSDLLAFARKRNPLNHMTVIFRKSAVLAAGNYQPFQGYEDYLLWVRMLLNGARLANLEEPLLNARVGNNMYARRHGIHFFRQELKLQREFRRLRFITLPAYYRNLMLRALPRLLPEWGIRFLYIFLRDHSIKRKK